MPGRPRSVSSPPGGCHDGSSSSGSVRWRRRRIRLTVMDPAPHDARRALVLHDRQLVVDLIELTLNHGVFVVHAASSLTEAEAILAAWHPHLAVVDMDHDDSTALLQRLGASNTLTASVTPVLGLTRRGDLQDQAQGLRPGGRRHPDHALLAGGAAGPVDRRHAARLGDRPPHHPHDHARRDGTRHPEARGPDRPIPSSR